MNPRLRTLGAAFYFFVAGLCFLGWQPARADTVTWDLNPTDNNWENPANWTPAVLPSVSATFGASNVTDITLPHGSDLTDMTFSAGASSFSFQLEFAYQDFFYFSNKGVQNDSSATQYFYVHSLLVFHNQASPGSNVVLTNVGNEGANFIDFGNTASAGTATIINDSSAVSAGQSNIVSFSDKSSAGSSSITNNNVLGFGAGTEFFSQSTAGQSTIVCNAGTFLIFADDSTAGESSLTANLDAPIIFNDNATAGAATLTTVDGGAITFNDWTRGGTARVNLIGGTLTVATNHHRTPVPIGSLESDESDGYGSLVYTASALQIGSNGLDTIYGGQFVSTGPEGTLTKIGSGKLTLTRGSPSLTGPVTITGGTLVATNTSGSATGAGDVLVNTGTLGGTGIIAGAVTVGTGSGAGAILQPSVGLSQTAKLTLQGALTFKADSTYTCKLSTQKRKADQVMANGVAIESGAQFTFTALANKRLASGMAFPVISNTSATPISGTFGNLADGSTLTAGRNKLLVSYTGGDGNDLTLTVE